jgi:hypothetical protein
MSMARMRWRELLDSVVSGEVGIGLVVARVRVEYVLLPKGTEKSTS